ncbi:MAG: LytTR family DNA-binding domain-containing protein [Saprospiraceae bacterium]
MSKIKTVIIEDEKASQELLSSIIRDYCPYLNMAGIASNVTTAAAMINDIKPDLVFLDIHIGHETGFDVLDILQTKDFNIIITTAHEEYALKAFKYEAIDYILKPYSPKDVIKSVQRIKEKLEKSKAFGHLEKIIKNNYHQRDNNRITIPTSEGLKVYKLDHITRIEGSGAYCKLFFTEEKSMLVSKSLKEIEEMLPEHQFFRTHDSHIIHLMHVKEYKKEDGGMVILGNGEQIPVSRRKKQEFLDRMMDSG